MARVVTWGALGPAVAAREERACADHARLLARDTTLWPADADTGAWLGWLASLDRAPAHLRGIDALVTRLVADGVDDVVLVGMGGSSLFPMVLAGVCGPAEGRPRLHVLDSTDPAAVRRVEDLVDWQRTALVAASKSGTTVETLAHLDRLLGRLRDVLGEATAARVVVVTDPGSGLEQRAEAEGWHVVHGDADVGGRYSALSPFGLLPAALLGLDADGLLARARTALDGWAHDPWSDGGPAQLGTLLACGVEAGRDALHLVVDARAGMLGAWIEQLVAESSGKDGTGVLPVVIDGVADVHAPDRAVVVVIGDADAATPASVPTLRLPWEGCEAIGVELLRWMLAVPLACAQLGVDPFDQPDVASAKAATADALASGREPEDAVALADVEATLDGGWAGAGYVAVLAYVDPEGPLLDAVRRGADRLARRHAVPVTVGVGPRYLHSTGQLHKGGRTDGVFLVVVGEDAADLDIPGRDLGFARLKRAQAAGDVAALRAAGRRVAVIDPHDPDLAA